MILLDFKKVFLYFYFFCLAFWYFGFNKMGDEKKIFRIFSLLLIFLRCNVLFAHSPFSRNLVKFESKFKKVLKFFSNIKFRIHGIWALNLNFAHISKLCITFKIEIQKVRILLIYFHCNFYIFLGIRIWNLEFWNK